MKHRSTRSLVAKIGLVFMFMAVIFTVMMMVLVRESILWTEDTMVIRHLQASEQPALAKYLTGADGAIQIDNATMAYNHPSLLPEFIPRDLLNRGSLVSEVELENAEYFLFVAEHEFNGEPLTIYLLAYADLIEISPQETRRLGLFIFLFMAILMAIFAIVLIVVSRRLVRPVMTLNQQLRQYQGDLDHTFELPKDSSSEFMNLLEHLNHYRADKLKLLQREQAFARYTSHELRTPLTIIKGASSLLNSNAKPEFQRRQQQRITSAANQMEETVEALLSLVRNERHELQEKERQVCADEIKQIINNNKPPALGNPIEISMDVQGCPNVRATKPLLAMVLGNLLRNAIGASTDGKVAVTMTNHSICIDDDGQGLGEKSKDGHGLGLMIVTDICQRYGWKFSLTNLDPNGCRAQIDFDTKVGGSVVPLHS